MLRYKVLLQLLLIMFLTMCLFVASYYFILRSYERVEANNLGLNRSRMLNALEQEVVRLDQINREWVDAGMMYALAQDPALVTFRNIVMEVIAGSFNVSHAAVFDADGNLLIGREANRASADLALDTSAPFIESIAGNARLLQQSEASSPVRGLLNIDGKIHLLSSRPLLVTPDSTGAGGALVAASRFDAQAVSAFADTIEQPVEISTIDDFSRDPANAAVLETLQASPDAALYLPVNRTRIDTYTLLRDINGEPAFVISSRSDRQFMQQATRTMLFTGIGVSLLFLLLIGFFLLFLDKSILRRLQGLSHTVGQLSDRRLEQRLSVSGNDEISAFSAAFNRVLDSLQDSQRTLTHQASHDLLTGLLNRRQFELELEQATEEACTGRDHHLLFIDLDRFKIINDSCGHMAGDVVLREIAQLMKAQLRTHDVLGRIGGDEFGVILRDCRMDSAHLVAENLRKAIVSFRFQAEERSFSFGASIGLLSLGIPEVLSRAAALTIADTACRTAKNSGRNRIHVHRSTDGSLNLQLQQTVWVNKINDALENNGFVFYAQQMVRLNPTGDKPENGVEMLLRLPDEFGGVISPGAFLPAAERYGMMNQIDKWVLENFCRWLARNLEGSRDIAFFSLNLSGQSLSDPDFTRYLVGLLEEHAVPKERLCFEITETAAIENLANTVKFIQTLNAAGCRFSLDDFGAGMSSFSYLKHLPVQLVKIDGAFCRNMHHDTVDRAMVKSITEIAHVMGLQTVAEYIESAETLQVSRELGIDFAQGYHLHVPEPVDNLLESTQRAD